MSHPSTPTLLSSFPLADAPAVGAIAPPDLFLFVNVYKKNCPKKNYVSHWIFLNPKSKQT